MQFVSIFKYELDSFIKFNENVLRHPEATAVLPPNVSWSVL